MSKSERIAALPEPVPTVDDTTSRLAERLVRQAIAGPADGRDVLLDLEIDGVRCVLLRANEPEQHALRHFPRPRPNTELSPREREIARMVAEGHPNKTIASVLEISSWTVNTHLRRIFAKLGVTSRAAMVARLPRG